ncbi:MAG: cation:proton antiporter [Phycisphaerales bacterium]|nr:cation:proton antiporter [Phycisphaerales bacterium]
MTDVTLTITLTLGAAGASRLLVDLVVILATAAVVSLVFGRLRLAAIPAYLVAGALIGPGLFGIIGADGEITSISNLAIVLLMFGIGLHMETSEIRSELVAILGVGVAACAACTLVFTPLAMLLGESLPAALLIAAAVSMSSTAAVMRLLQQRREIRDLHGRVAFGTLIVQDLYAVAVLACVPVLAAWQGLGDADAGTGLGMRALTGVAGLAAIVGLGRWLLPRILHQAGRDGGTELVLIVGAGAALGSAAATAWLGFSPELGAFLAGFLLASTPARHQLIGQLAPLRDLFLPVFFVAVGLGLDLRTAIDNWWVVLIAVPVVMGLKALIAAAAAWSFGMAGPVAAMSGVVLAQTGEFTLVVLAAGVQRGLVSGPTAAIMGVVVGVTLMLTPGLFGVAPALGRLFVRVPTPPWQRRALRDIAGRHPGREPPGLRAVVAGFGPVGRETTNRLERAGFRVTVIELNPETVKKQRGLGRSVVYGDVANPEVLHQAGVEHADAVLLTMPDHDAVLRACRLVRSIAPDCFLAVRSGFLSRGLQALAVGADQITIDEIATAAQMAEEVCGRLADRLAARGAKTAPGPGVLPGEGSEGPVGAG